jgi:hypothetical protein
MSKVLSSIGVVFAIGTETVADTKPTIWNKIPQVVENSEFDLDPDTIDTTSYDNLKYKSSIPGLIDTSGIQYLTANATESEDAESVWDAAVTVHETTGAHVWLCVVIPDMDNATFIPIIPIKTGAYTTTVNDRITIKLKFTIAGDLEFAKAPSIS